MEDFSPSVLKTILHSKRANLYYLEYCRVQVNGGRVEYVTDEGKASAYWNIPIANTTSMLLGTGTSITQAAMRELAKAGVMVGFCGGAGSPLFSGTDIQWFNPQSEYRPTEYLQQWARFWFDDEKRLQAARIFQTVRANQIELHWMSIRNKKNGFLIDSSTLNSAIKKYRESLVLAKNQNDIFSHEAVMTRTLYRLAINAVDYGEFVRAKGGSGTDLANQFLDHGNYLAYGLASTAAWVLGLPAGLAVLHGKTRRGGLVFDIADLIKDAVVLPQAFCSAAEGHEPQQFRSSCLQGLRNVSALDTMIDTLKDTALQMSQA